MTALGQIVLLVAFAASGYAAFACIAGAWTGQSALQRGGEWAGWVSALCLTVVLVILARALYVSDFQFAYVDQHSSRLLPWYYALSALWVGQAGSLLLWTWMSSVLALVFLTTISRKPGGDDEADRIATRSISLGLLMAFTCFLSATMVFAADPMEPSIRPGADGSGLNPLLQHPAMLIHPPVVFLGYAGWAIPCALMIAALVRGVPDRRDLELVRRWTMLAWAVLGVGILLGAQWSYEELGWGGYWAWDPVENGSLIPWLTGTAFLHALMAWRHRGQLRRTAATLAVVTFALCNLAAFLTRSGVFSSLHAFSRSPIGWLFLVLMVGLALAGAWLVGVRWARLGAENRLPGLISCEASVAISTLVLIVLALAVLGGTLFEAFSEVLAGRRMLVGREFYDNALKASGFVLLAMMAHAPLLQWGRTLERGQKRALGASVVVAILGAGICAGFRSRSLIMAGVVGLMSFATAALAGRLAIDVLRHPAGTFWKSLGSTLRVGRRRYAGFVAHLGLLCIALGIAGSSLGTMRHEFDLTVGETIEWAGHTIRYARLDQSRETDKVIVAAELVISKAGGAEFVASPAQHWHLSRRTWTTEAAILSRWSGDFYAILHNGEGDRAHFTFVINPLMRWMWLGGWLIALAALVGAWPERSVRRPEQGTKPTATSRGARFRPHRGSRERSVPVKASSRSL